MALAAVAAIAIDVAGHHPLASLAAVLAVATVAAVSVVAGPRRPSSVGLAVAAVAAASLLALRASWWVVVPAASVAVGLLVVAAGHAPGGPTAGFAPRALALLTARVARSAVAVPADLGASAVAWVPLRDERDRRRLLAVGRGVGIALPVVVVLAVLLASADAVFASIFALPDLTVLGGHLVGLALGLLVAGTLLLVATPPPSPAAPPPGVPLGPTEATVVLASVAVLFAAFAATQAVALAGGADHVLATAGLTYAEYARQGFFQLLAVAALTLVLLGAIRSVTRSGTRAQRVRLTVLAEVVVALALVVVAVAIGRLDLYEAAFGSTLLRLACTWVAWWLGVVFVLVGVALTPLGRPGRLAAAVVASAVVAVGAWGAVNPDAQVASRNLDRAAAGGELDAGYLHLLSDDAVPTLAAGLDALDPADRAAVLHRVCLVAVGQPGPAAPPPAATDAATGPTSSTRWRASFVPGPGAPGGGDPPSGLPANRSLTAAATSRAQVCP